MKISFKDLSLSVLLTINKQLQETNNIKEIKRIQRKIKLITEEESE